PFQPRQRQTGPTCIAQSYPNKGYCSPSVYPGEPLKLSSIPATAHGSNRSAAAAIWTAKASGVIPSAAAAATRRLYSATTVANGSISFSMISPFPGGTSEAPILELSQVNTGSVVKGCPDPPRTWLGAKFCLAQ